MNLTPFEKIINPLFPGLVTKRLQQRAQQEVIQEEFRHYEAITKGRRTKNRKTPSTSANAEIYPSIQALRNTSRALVRNNPYVFDAIVRKLPNNIVGFGIVPTPISTSQPQLKKIKKVWNDWANSRMCDYEEHSNFYGLQKMVMRTVAESGECIIRKRIIKGDKVPLNLQIQVLEPDYIDTLKHSIRLENNGNYVFYGIEYTPEGKVVAYWLYDEHPGENITFKLNVKSQRYPIEDIIHVFEKLRPQQARGVPFGVSSYNRTHDLDDFQDAQLYRQKVAACWSVFIRQTNPVIGTPPSADDDSLSRVEPGMIYKMNPGEEITFGSPPPAEGYRDYTTTVLGEISHGFGMDMISFTGDYSQVNFSSGRMAWLDFHRNISDWQWNMIIPMFCDRVWEWFTEMAAIYGYVKPGAKVAVNWTVPKREMIDPTKEIKASIESFQKGLMPWSDVVQEAGYNPDEQLEKMKADKEAFEKAGLPIYTMEQKQPGSPAPPDTTDQPVNQE